MLADRISDVSASRLIMVTREDVVAELQKVPERHLDEIYLIIRNYQENDKQPESESVMARLRQIRISASRDFSTNANLFSLAETDAR